MGWAAFGVLLIVFAVTMVWGRSQTTQRTQELEADHRRRVAALTSEADARTARVERASKAEAERRGVALAEDLLPVADALGDAVDVPDGATAADVRAGVELARKELDRAFAAHDIRPIAPEVGDTFDPVVHEAVEKIGDGTTIHRLYRQGFRHGDRVLRSAMVVVGPDAHDEEE